MGMLAGLQCLLGLRASPRGERRVGGWGLAEGWAEATGEGLGMARVNLG